MSFNPQTLKAGVVFKHNDKAYVSLSCQQKVSGRQRSVVGVRAQDLKTNQVSDFRFRGSEDVEIINTVKTSANFLYSDQSSAYFIEPDNYQQHSLNLRVIGDKVNYLAPGQKVILMFIEDSLETIDLPKTVCLTVVEAEPAVRGDTVKAPNKLVKVETGLKIKVPIFIKVGDKIVIDTLTNSYQKREDAA